VTADVAAVITTTSREIRRKSGLFAVTAAVTGVVLWRLPGTAGTSWAEVNGSLRAVGLADLGLLTIVWAAGLWSHSWVLTASLPGLSRGRALLLNLGGSAVCDLVPFGAAAGSAMNLAMIRSWRFSTAAFATFTAVSNLWNVLAKLGLPAVVLTAAIAGGTLRSSPHLLATAVAALGLLLLLGISAAVAIGSQRAAVMLGRAVDAVAQPCLRAAGSARRTAFSISVPAARAQTADVIRRGWPQLTAGMAGYLMLQALLWWMCLDMLSNQLPIAVMLAGFAVERVLSMLPLTPGGAGLAEAGSIAVLVPLGADPMSVTAAVLLFRGFAFLLEIPVGGAAILTWFWLRPRPVVA
jgi:uncharacterized membrane protein YbhN (UPF0104 family)